MGSHDFSCSQAGILFFFFFFQTSIIRSSPACHCTLYVSKWPTQFSLCEKDYQIHARFGCSVFWSGQSRGKKLLVLDRGTRRGVNIADEIARIQATDETNCIVKDRDNLDRYVNVDTFIDGFKSQRCQLDTLVSK